METTFPRGGMFWPCQQQAFQRCCFAVLVNFSETRERKKEGRRKEGEMNKQQNNFLCEFSRGDFFFTVKRGLSREKSGLVSSSRTIRSLEHQSCFPNEQIKLFCVESRKKRGVKKERHRAEAILKWNKTGKREWEIMRKERPRRSPEGDNAEW